MTAEIAILNKSAIALAADSAVTISAGEREQKIFDSADKLFELSNCNPIGVMIYSGMNFMETPLPSLIRDFRRTCPSVTRVEEAAEKFLLYLAEFARSGSESIREESFRTSVSSVIKLIQKRFTDRLQTEILEAEDLSSIGDFSTASTKILEEVVSAVGSLIERCSDSLYVGGGRLSVSAASRRVVREMISEQLGMANSSIRSRILEIALLCLRKYIPEPSSGIVVAGFGADDLFPTLVSFEVGAFVCGRLKYFRTNHVDIDRRGARAKVIPFAQKEMVERFLYGLDASIQRQISRFCEDTVPDIRKELINALDLPTDEERDLLADMAATAETAFIKGLQEKAFNQIQSQSRAEIEDMVEFMPKPELAKMAEALVNLTSIKRRVSRGLETVGGPIDVAIISQAEGFVWIKRKHYFPHDLNGRYVERVRGDAMRRGDDYDGRTEHPGEARRAGRRQKRAGPPS